MNIKLKKRVLIRTVTNEGMTAHIEALITDSDTNWSAVHITKRCFYKNTFNDVPHEKIIRRLRNNIVLVEESISLKPGTLNMIACEV